MDSFELNKIAGAVLFAMLVIVGFHNLGNIAVSPTQLAEPAYVIDVPEEETAVADAGAATEQQPIGPLLASASPEQGQTVARRCATCHTFEQGGPDRVGPNLWGVVGSDKAEGGFAFSAALADMPGEWTYEDLAAFLSDPRGYAPGTKMAFAGIRRTDDLANLIAYMRTMHDNPPPLPEAGAEAEAEPAQADGAPAEAPQPAAQ